MFIIETQRSSLLYGCGAIVSDPECLLLYRVSSLYYICDLYVIATQACTQGEYFVWMCSQMARP
jgi:hypothetical protein